MQQTERFAIDVKAQFARVIVGQETIIEHVVLALLLGEHVLLEGVPGVAKTLLVRTLARILGVDFKRIQFTPDMMPSDIIGTSVFDLTTNQFHLRKGPIFTNLLLADEINRTPPKTQAALLEVMEEKQATIEGAPHPMDWPFMVCATINPVEFEGTYILPEAQLDRFLFKLLVDYPEPEQERDLLRRVDQGFSARNLDETTDIEAVASPERLRAAADAVAGVTVSDEVLTYISALADASRDAPDILLGASPRAAIAMLRAGKARAAIHGREYVTPDDVKALCPPILRHRLVLRPETEIEGRGPEEVIDDLLETVEVPR